MLRNTFPIVRNIFLSAALTITINPAVFAKNIAEAVFLNGRIETLNQNQPQAQAVAVKGGRFIAIGSDEKIKTLIGEGTQVTDLKQKLVTPGFIDGHTHPVETIWLKNEWVDARYPETASVKELLVKLADRVKSEPAGKWIYVACVSASQNKFLEKRLPTKEELDHIAPNNPVIVANGAHMAIANSIALTQMGATKGVSKLKHGAGVLLDSEANPTGTITDGMGDIPGSPTLAQIQRYFQSDIAKFWNQYGFTSMTAITPAAVVPVLQKIADNQASSNIRFSISVWAAPNGEGMPENLDRFEMPKNANSDYFRFIGIKAWVDGENDCRTGLMYEPYLGTVDTDPPGGLGTQVTTQEGADRFVSLADKNKKISMLHCSGDAAVDIGLSAIENLLKTNPEKHVRRIEHFGMFQLTETQLRRSQELKKHGFHFSIQPIWLSELVKADYENMGAKRAETGYQFKTLINAGLEPAASTDMTGIYLGNINPFSAIYAVVSRESDMGIFQPQEAIDVRDALKMWTIWPAKAMGEENDKGTIEVGKFADMVVMSKNLLEIPIQELKDAKAYQTIIGGRVVFQADFLDGTN